MIKNLILWLVSALILMSVFSNFGPHYAQVTKLSYSQFLDKIEHGEVKQVTIDNQMIDGVTHSGETFSTYAPNKPDNPLIESWHKNNGVMVAGKAPEQTGYVNAYFY